MILPRLMACRARPLRPTNGTTARGQKSTPHPDPEDPPRRHANKRRGHGTHANDRPPIIRLISREPGEQRFWVGDHADTRTCAALIAENVLTGGTQLYTEEWQSSRGSHPGHATVRHGRHEWAREADGDGRREAHCNTCKGAGAVLRTFLQVFWDVHKPYLHLYVATYEALVNAKRVTPRVIRRVCVGS